LESLRGCAREPDGAFLAGLVALRSGELVESERHLTEAVRRYTELGQLFGRLGLEAELRLPVTEEISAVIAPDRRGALLGLVEVYQAQGRPAEAILVLRQLRELEPGDPVIRLSLMELLAESATESQGTWQELVRLAQGIEDESAVHAAVLLYKARALRELGLLDAAREVLSAALRKKRGRPKELLLALSYERALVYEAQGRTAKARADLEKIYAASPDFEDVAARLGL
jgi:tetratricopeptide (TPR) repeat protein